MDEKVFTLLYYPKQFPVQQMTIECPYCHWSLPGIASSLLVLVLTQYT